MGPQTSRKLSPAKYTYTVVCFAWLTSVWSVGHSLTGAQPTHVTIYATTPPDVSQRAVMDKITTASGSKSHVK